VSDKRLAVDNINNLIEFTWSKHILKQIHNFFPDMNLPIPFIKVELSFTTCT